jgi:hypothetical protein
MCTHTRTAGTTTPTNPTTRSCTGSLLLIASTTTTSFDATHAGTNRHSTGSTTCTYKSTTVTSTGSATGTYKSTTVTSTGSTTGTYKSTTVTRTGSTTGTYKSTTVTKRVAPGAALSSTRDQWTSTGTPLLTVTLPPAAVSKEKLTACEQAGRNTTSTCSIASVATDVVPGSGNCTDFC